MEQSNLEALQNTKAVLSTWVGTFRSARIRVVNSAERFQRNSQRATGSAKTMIDTATNKFSEFSSALRGKMNDTISLTNSVITEEGRTKQRLQGMSIKLRQARKRRQDLLVGLKESRRVPRPGTRRQRAAARRRRRRGFLRGRGRRGPFSSDTLAADIKTTFAE